MSEEKQNKQDVIINMNQKDYIRNILEQLAKPFRPDQIKWKIQTNPKDKEQTGWAILVAYLDARDVAERLDIVCAGDWHDEYVEPPMSFTSLDCNKILDLECRLTVCGVTRRDVGSVSIGDKADKQENAIKELYSDSFKRAAVKFGLGRVVYRFPAIRGMVKLTGNNYYIMRETTEELDDMTLKVINGENLPRYKNIQILGDFQEAGTVDDLESKKEKQQKQQQSEKPQDLLFKFKQQIYKLRGQYKANGGSDPYLINEDISSYDEAKLRAYGKTLETALAQSTHN